MRKNEAIIRLNAFLERKVEIELDKNLQIAIKKMLKDNELLMSEVSNLAIESIARIRESAVVYAEVEQMKEKFKILNENKELLDFAEAYNYDLIEAIDFIVKDYLKYRKKLLI